MFPIELCEFVEHIYVCNNQFLPIQHTHTHTCPEPLPLKISSDAISTWGMSLKDREYPMPYNHLERGS